MENFKTFKSKLNEGKKRRSVVGRFINVDEDGEEEDDAEVGEGEEETVQTSALVGLSRVPDVEDVVGSGNEGVEYGGREHPVLGEVGGENVEHKVKPARDVEVEAGVWGCHGRIPAPRLHDIDHPLPHKNDGEPRGSKKVDGAHRPVL